MRDDMTHMRIDDEDIEAWERRQFNAALLRLALFTAVAGGLLIWAWMQ